MIQTQYYLKLRIYKAQWKVSNIFMIRWGGDSCYLCETYYEDGTRILWNDELLYDFYIYSKQWMLIYECGIGLQDK